MTVLDEAYDLEYEEAYDLEYDEAAEDAESRRRRRVALPRTAPMPQRPTNRPVTQAQLQMAVNRLDGYINRNSAAIKRVDGSVASLGRNVRQQGKSLSSTRDAIILLPLLSPLFAENPTLGVLFPILLLGGFGGSQSGSGGGGLFGGDSSTMLILVLALSGALNPNQTV
jgi:hypothetical protein